MAGRQITKTPLPGASGSPPRLAPALSPLILNRVRLAILAALATGPELSFNDLRELTRTTDGNLLTHLRRLESAGFLASHKTGVGRAGRTTYRLTEDGRDELRAYLDEMERLLMQVRKK